MEDKILYGQRGLNNQGNPTNRLIGAHSGSIDNDLPNLKFSAGHPTFTGCSAGRMQREMQRGTPNFHTL
jgi:hypothetical protein